MVELAATAEKLDGVTMPERGEHLQAEIAAANPDVRALPQLGGRRRRPTPVAKPLRWWVRAPRPLAMAGAAQAFDFGRHRPIGDATDHLAQQIRVRALLKKARAGGVLSTDILGLSGGGGVGPPTRVCGRSTMTASRVRRVSPNSLSVARRAGLSAFGIQ